MARIIGIYWLAAAGLILFAVTLGLAPVFGELGGIVLFMCVDVGIGNGDLMVCVSLRIYPFVFLFKKTCYLYTALHEGNESRFGRWW